MKKILLLILLFAFSLGLNAQTPTKLYKSGAFIKVEKTGSYEMVFNPSQSSYRAGFDNVMLMDNIRGSNKTLIYSELTDSSGAYYGSKQAVIEFLDYNMATFKLESDGALAVNIQDQTTPLIIASFSKEEAATTLFSQAVINLNQIAVDDATGFVIGQYLSIFNIEANRFYLGSVNNVSGVTITLDTPLDFDYPAGSFVTVGTKNMNVNGSVTPVVYGVRNTDEQIGSAFDIVRIIIHCQTSASIDLSKFGDIAGGLTNGIVLRKVDGVQRNIFNAKTNGDLKTLMYDFDIEAASGNQQDGFTGRMTFGGQSKMGVVIRLEAGEDLQIVIQDDLTDLEIFEIICEGHTVQ